MQNSFIGMSLRVSVLYFLEVTGQREQSQHETEIWTQTRSVVWLMLKGELLDDGVELIISMSKEVIFLFKVCITLDFKCDLFYFSLMSSLLNRVLFWKEEMLEKIF